MRRLEVDIHILAKRSPDKKFRVAGGKLWRETFSVEVETCWPLRNCPPSKLSKYISTYQIELLVDDTSTLRLFPPRVVAAM